MPIEDDLYWNSIDFGSEETLNNYPSTTINKQYVDPWDLENYAYIRQHLNSIDSSDEPTTTKTTNSSGEFLEANSTSFYYIPVGGGGGSNQNLINSYSCSNQTTTDKYESILTEQGNYVAIDEEEDDIEIYDKNKKEKRLNIYSDVPKTTTTKLIANDDYDSEINENLYEENIKDFSNTFHHHQQSPFNLYETKDRWIQRFSSPKDRSLSFSYGDYDYDPYNFKNNIYSKLDELNNNRRKDATLPIYADYDETSNTRHLNNNKKIKPKNFGLSNYGHLKIDYSYSWNNLNKYICN